MTVNRLNAPRLSRICGGIRLYKRKNHNAVSASEYTDEPEYPPILDMSRNAKKRREKEAWHAKITKLPTVEQKFMELNMPKYYGYWSCHIKDTSPTLNGLPFLKYSTRTHLINALPDDYYDEVMTDSKKIASKIQDQVESLIDFNFNTTLNRKSGKDITAVSFMRGLHRILNGTLASSVEHIKDSVVDLQPCIKAFWFLGGLQPDRILKKQRKNFKIPPLPEFKVDENDPVDRPMQSISTPAIGVRVNLGLPEVVPIDHPLATTTIPVENLDPRAYGYRFRHDHAVIKTGFWPGENKEHCQLWMHTYGFADSACKFINDKYLNSYIQQKMIVSSFSQAFAHASYLGFGPVTELTYPIVQQSVLSDGQKWNFSVYQLNTCALHSEYAIENPVSNILWLNDEQHLFEAVDNTGVKGFNIDVLANLVAMYLKKGIDRENATPYLAPYKYLAKHPAPEEYRSNFHNYLLQYIFSGRPRSLEKPEMYLWEKIYKVDFKTRPYEPPRRFFEPHFAQRHPGMRRLDDYSPIYIPKELQKEKRVKYKPRLNSEHLYKYD